MILLIEHRKTSEVDVFDVVKMEDVSRGFRTLVKLTLRDGETDEVDLHTTRITPIPNAV